MRKITSLLMLLCVFVGMAWAAPTDLPEMSTEGNIKYYTISNTRSTSGKYLYWTESGVKDANTLKLSSLFYFTGTAEECYIHNAATNLLFTGAGAWNSTGVKCEISVTPHGDGTTGLAIKFSGTALNEANTNNGYTTWGADDAGSVFVMEVANVTKMATDYKTAANSALDKISFLGVDEAKATIANLEANINTFAAVDAAVNGVAEYVAFRNGETNINSVRYNNYLAAYMPNSKGHGSATFNWLTAVWSLKYSGEGSFYIYNVNEEVYLGNPGSNGALTQTPNSAYTFEVIEENKVEFKCGGQTLHMNNHNGNGTVASGNALTNYDDNDVASRWYVETDFAAHVATYKTTAQTTLDSWKTLSVVFDGALVDVAKTAINDIATTNYATFAAIDAELKKVTDAVAAKMFTFQTLATDNKRNGVWVSANASTGKAIGAETQDYNAIWSLRHAGGVSFYIYNELTAKYMGKPSGNAALTDTPVDAYTFEIIDAANGVVEFKCGGETLHASNNDDDKLMNYDADEAASRWYIRTIDIAADIQAILDGLTSEDYAETPALGQYPTAAYEALVAARTTAKTVEEVEAAIVAFKASLNRPVYFITSMHNGYAAGSAIYFDGAWKWKTANIYDKQMWMTIPGYTQPNVPVVDAYEADGTNYEICDYLTGTVMRGKKVQIVKIADWEGAYNLQYNADANSTDAAHHAKDNGQLVNWKPATSADSKASAWQVEYIGTSYELANLTDEKIEALDALKTAYDAKAYYKNAVIGNGIGQYKGDKDAIVAELAKAEAVYVKTLVEQAAMTVEEINAITKSITDVAALTLNMPSAGFYRIASMNSSLHPENKGKFIQSDGGNLKLAETKDVNSILYLDGSNMMISYALGSYLNNYSAPEAKGGAGSAWTFIENAQVIGTYTLDNPADKQGGEQYFLSDWTGNVTYGGNDVNAAWMFEEVAELPITISPAGYATFYCPVAVTLPEGLEAYYVGEITNNLAKMTLIEGVIPANTGVILKGNEGTYDLTIATETSVASDETNLLTGTVASAYVEEDSYVLSMQTEGVGFYKAMKNFYNNNGIWTKDTDNTDKGTHFLNNGFKAYLPASVVPSEARFLSFDFGNETAIESIEGAENGANAVIYDLSGRRVQKAQKGLYIVNGVKVIK